MITTGIDFLPEERTSPGVSIYTYLSCPSPERVVFMLIGPSKNATQLERPIFPKKLES